MSEKLYFQLFSKLFEIIKKQNITSLSSLTNENILISLLRYIEPNIESYGKTFEIINENNFGIRYSNFLNILEVLETFKINCTGKDSFRLTAKFSDIIKINDLLKINEEQLCLLCDIILFITAISSKKDTFFDIVTEQEEKLCNLYYQAIEKFMILGGDDTFNGSKLERSYIGTQQLNKIKESYEKQIEELQLTINDKHNIISEIKNKNENLENKINEMELRCRDKDKEIEILKEDRKQNLILQEQYYNETLSKGELAGQLSIKDNEINNIKVELKQTKKKFMDEINNYKERIIILEDKLKESNIKLDKTNKHKELKNDNKNECQHNKISNEKIKEIIAKEKQTYQNQIERLYKEIKAEKQKHIRSEEEKKKLEKDIENIKKEYENIVKEKNKINLNSFSDESEYILKDLNKKESKELNELKIEKNDLLKMCEDKTIEINQLIKVKDDLQNQLETNKMEINRLNRKIKDTENETKKNASKDKNYHDLEKKLKETENKYKENYAQIKKENDKLKNELSSNKNNMQKMIYNKDKLMNNYKKEIEKLKNENKSNKKIKYNNKDNNPLLSSIQIENEINNLKNEVKSLKNQMKLKDDKIQHLQNQIFEKENNDENEFYKRSFEEQKLRVNEEHKLISDSLYKLAVHFMSLKDDLQKKFNVNNK